MRSEFEKHFLSLKFATKGSAQRCLDSCTFDSEQDAYLPDVNWISDNDEDECVIYCCMLNTSYISFKDQQSKVDELQKRVDELHTAFKQLIEMENESISFEHDLFDKGWNQSARQTIENIYKLAGLGEQALKGGGDE